MKVLAVFIILSASLWAAPTCVIVQRPTWRAGEVTSLSSTGSSGSGTLSYSWQQIAGEPVRWVSDRTGDSPYIEPPVFGEYTFQLTVTDANGSTSCTGTFGAVAMDSNGVVVPDTSTPNKAKIHQLIGPIIARGRNPWAYADYQADFSANVIDSCWNKGPVGGACGTGEVNNHKPRTQQDQWEAGTLTLTVGSNIVTCTDDERGPCAMMTKLCGGDASWTGGHYLNVRYPVAGTDPQEYGWKQLQPFSPTTEACVSETQFKIGSNWSNTGYATGTVQSGLYWSDDQGTNSLWLASAGAAQTINYYDSALFLYQMYYRTGLLKWKTWADWVVDAWWEHPYRDAGRVNNAASPRAWALTGMVIRYLGGRTDMLPGLRRIWNYYSSGGESVTAANKHGGERENGYRLEWVGLCALAEADLGDDRGSLKDQCSASAQSSLSLWRSVQCKPGFIDCVYQDGQWIANNGSWAPHSFSAPGGFVGTLMKVTTGSNVVEFLPGTTNRTLNEVTFNANYRFWVSRSGLISSFDDRETYTATKIDSTHLQLDRPYEGRDCESGCDRQWQYAEYVGNMIQPYMAGIFGHAFMRVYQATGSPLGLTLSGEVAYWIKDHGVRSAHRGLWYSVYMPGCGTPPRSGGCGASAYQSSRALTPEVLRFYSNYYGASQDTEIRDVVDNLYGAIYGRVPTYPCASAISGTCDGTYIDTPIADPTNDKWPGFFCGEGGCLTWPAARLGPRSPQSRVIMIYFSKEDHPDAVDAQVDVQDTNGVIVDSEVCTDSPCAVAVRDDDIGNHRYRINLRDSLGNVVLPGGWEFTPVR